METGAPHSSDQNDWQPTPHVMMSALRHMLEIRHFETRAEGAYLQGKVGGFFHSYIGQEAIQTAAVLALGVDHWWVTTYRCHALALLLGATPDELMCELFGKANGNSLGRGGSMHFFTKHLLGGFGIVGGHIPTATGAAFAIKYRKEKKKIALCFLGDGAVAQGAFHESLNLAALWDLPILYVIENNQWGMGTHVKNAISVKKLAEEKAPGYGMEGVTADGMDFLTCYKIFKNLGEQIFQTSRPVLLELKTERFKGHSISDPAAYRSKKELETCKKDDPIFHLTQTLLSQKICSQVEIDKMNAQAKEKMIRAVTVANESPLPDPIHLEEDVFAP